MIITSRDYRPLQKKEHFHPKPMVVVRKLKCKWQSSAIRWIYFCTCCTVKLINECCEFRGSKRCHVIWWISMWSKWSCHTEMTANRIRFRLKMSPGNTSLKRFNNKEFTDFPKCRRSCITPIQSAVPLHWKTRNEELKVSEIKASS